MTDAPFPELIAATTGLMLLTSVLQMWRRSLTASIRLLAVQGVALAGLVAAVAGAQVRSPAGAEAGGGAELVLACLMILVVKGAGLPWALARTARTTQVRREPQPLVNPTAGVLAAAALTTLAYAVSQPIVALDPGPAARAVPVGVALVLIGFLILLSHRSALSQLIGLVVLDNGIAAVAFLTAGGLPLVVELGVTLDVLLVVLILRVLTGRLQFAFGATDLDDLTELRD
jgi:hydrogenase-4 component E